MARSKMKLEYINNDATRRSTLRKRSKGLLKKVHEISVLCGNDACGIIYSPEEAVPQVWPQPLDAKRILTEFNNLPELERSRKSINHLAYMQERLNTLLEKVVKDENANIQVEVRAMLYEGFGGCDFAQLNACEVDAALTALDEMMSEVFERMRVMMGLSAGAQTGGGVALGTDAHVPTPAIPEVGPSTPSVSGDLASSSDDEDSDEDDY